MNHSHLLQGPIKTESIRKKEWLLYSCARNTWMARKGNCSVLGCTLLSCVWGSWVKWGRKVPQSQSSLHACHSVLRSNVSHTVCYYLESGSRLCFVLPKIQGEVSSCVRLEMPCGMQGSGKKSKPLAYRPQSWHRLRLWASHNCLGTAVLFCWHVICLQQYADWACLSIVALILPLLCLVEHFYISVVDRCSSLISAPFHSRQEQKQRDVLPRTNTTLGCEYVLFVILAGFTNLWVFLLYSQSSCQHSI